MAIFGPFWSFRGPVFFGPINRGSFGPNGRFPGTFWPNPSLLGCLRSLKKIGSKLALQFFLSTFPILVDFAGFEAYYRVSGLGRPPKRPKNPQGRPKKRVLARTLGRGGVTGRTTPLFPCTLRVPYGFRRVRDPKGTILTTSGLPGGPAGPGRAGNEIFSVGVPGGQKPFCPEEFLCSKTLFIGF